MDILSELSWLKWAAMALVGLAVLGLFLKMGGHHLTEPLFRQCKVLLSTRAGRWLLRGVIITATLGGLGWSLYAGIQYLESAEQTRIASNEKRSRQEAFSLLYRVMSQMQPQAEAPEGPTTENKPWYKAVFAKVLPDKSAARDVNKVVGCITPPFQLIENNPAVVATATIDNDGNARSMRIVVNEPNIGLTDLADMKLRITERATDAGKIGWVVERDSLTRGGFPDDASYERGVTTTLQQVFLGCAVSNTVTVTH